MLVQKSLIVRKSLDFDYPTGIPLTKWPKINLKGIINIDGQKEFDAPKVLDYPFHIDRISHDDPKMCTLYSDIAVSHGLVSA